MNEFLTDPFQASNPHKDFISRIRLIEGDIVQQRGVEAIVTCLNLDLDMRDDLNQAIMAAAGPALDRSILENIYRPRAGDVYVLPGYDLPVKHILIAMTPEWRPGAEGEDRDLLRCYRGILEMAERMRLTSLALPAIGMGKNQFPVARAARLALQAVRERMPDRLNELRIICSHKAAYDAFMERLRIIG